MQYFNQIKFQIEADFIESSRKDIDSYLNVSYNMYSGYIQGVPENLCPVCLKIATKRQKVLTILLLDVALQMFN